MAVFSKAVAYVLDNEDYRRSGLVTSEPNGGKARLGINSVFHPKAVADGFYEMSKEAALSYAMRVYETEYWDGRGFSTITDQNIATKLFDMAVNMGNGGEIGVLQRALGIQVTHNFDGVTQVALAKASSDFMNTLIQTLKTHYHEIHDKHPEKYDKVIEGWINRANKVPK